MPSLTLLLAISITAPTGPSFYEPEGPLFHRWVPNGSADALRLSAANDPYQLSVWFERRAKKDPAGFLRWDREGSQFDPETMQRQEKLDGGVLYGELTLVDVPEAALAAMKEHPIFVGEKFGNEPLEKQPPYIALGKKVVEYAQPRLSRLINQLRNQYGQHWLRDLSPWDSRRSTLGSYCLSLGLKWRSEDGRMCRFMPTNLGEEFELQPAPGREYGEYLTEKDWRRLQAAGFEADATIELELLGNATRLLDLSENRHAFVEVVTALEIAIANRVRSDNKAIQLAMQSFTNGPPLKTQAAVLMKLLQFSSDEIIDVLAIVKMRNAIVHEGKAVSPDDTATLRRAMTSVAKLVGLDELKMPVLSSGNAMSPPGGGRIRVTGVRSD